MKYSVIIPAYQCEGTLEKTVNSICNCGLMDYEIILVDDGSPDGTPALCDRLASEYENIRCFHQQNSGVSSARNHGLREAKGDYVWFFDSDDLVDPGSMMRPMEIVDQYTPDMLIFGMRFEFYKREQCYERLEVFYDEEGVFSREELDSLYSELFHHNALSSSCNKLIRRNLLITHHLEYDTKLFSMEDFHFVLNVLQYCNQVYLLPQALYRYIHQTVRPRGTQVRDNHRMEKINDVSLYLEAFEPLLINHPDLLVALHYTMVGEKISRKKPNDMQETANQFRNSKYASEEYLAFCTPSQRAFAEMLINGEFKEIYKQNRKQRIRAKIVGVVKATSFYRRCRGTAPRKVRF